MIPRERWACLGLHGSSGPPPVLHSDPFGGTFDPHLWRGRSRRLGALGRRKRASDQVELAWLRMWSVTSAVSCSACRLGGALISHFNLSSIDVLLTSPENKNNNLKRSDTILFFSPASFFQFFYPFICTVSGSSVESKETKHMNFSTTQSFRLEATVTSLQVNIHCVNILLFPILQIYYL